MKAKSQKKYKWNIYSSTLQDFLFASDLDNETVTIDVPDGEYELFLYQTGSSCEFAMLPMCIVVCAVKYQSEECKADSDVDSCGNGECVAANNVDLASVEAQTQIIASTVPAKKDNDTDFAYGLPKELLTQAFLYTDGEHYKTASTNGFSPHGMSQNAHATGIQKRHSRTWHVQLTLLICRTGGVLCADPGRCGLQPSRIRQMLLVFPPRARLCIPDDVHVWTARFMPF